MLYVFNLAEKRIIIARKEKKKQISLMLINQFIKSLKTQRM